jgi:hypothetical protein
MGKGLATTDDEACLGGSGEQECAPHGRDWTAIATTVVGRRFPTDREQNPHGSLCRATK